jgi:hypothetical protein
MVRCTQVDHTLTSDPPLYGLSLLDGADFALRLAYRVIRLDCSHSSGYYGVASVMDFAHVARVTYRLLHFYHHVRSTQVAQQWLH